MQTFRCSSSRNNDGFSDDGGDHDEPKRTDGHHSDSRERSLDKRVPPDLRSQLSAVHDKVDMVRRDVRASRDLLEERVMSNVYGIRKQLEGLGPFPPGPPPPHMMRGGRFPPRGGPPPRGFHPHHHHPPGFYEVSVKD